MNFRLPTLRDYQNQSSKEIEAEFDRGTKRVLLESPTGSGKGAISTHKTGTYIQAGGRVLFLVNRRALVHDMSRRMEAARIPYGVMMAADTRNIGAPAIIASVDTFRRRADRWPAANLVIVDEAHTAVSPKWQEITRAYVGTGSNILSMTATPITSVGGGLRNIADVIIPGPSMQSLIDAGHLIKPVVYAPTAPDLKGVQTRQGDYVIEQLSRVMGDNGVHGNIIETWLKHGKGRPTVAFCVDVAHAEALAARFVARGVRTIVVSAETPDREREQIWRRLASGQIEIVCSVMLISYGWDCPPVSCAIMARPTKSLGLYLQQGGRVLRVAPGKVDALILDHAGCTMRHGFLTDRRTWTLDGVDKSDPRPQGKEPKTCPTCHAVYAGSQCPQCGHGHEKVIDLGDDWAMERVRKPAIANLRVDEIPPAYLSKAFGAAYQLKLDLRKDPALVAIAMDAAQRSHKPGAIWYRAQELVAAREAYRQTFGREAPLDRTTAEVERAIDRKKPVQSAA